MADPKEVLKYFKLSVKVEQEPGEEIRNHLRNTILGTPGKLRYRHTSFDSKLPFVGRIFFIILRKAEKLLGSIAFSHRPVYSNRESAKAWYIRYFSVQAPLRDTEFKRNRLKREGKGKHSENTKPHGESLLKNLMQPYFDEPDNLLNGKALKNPQSLVYAYVERENLRSWNFTELVGFETIGKVSTAVFTRYNPKIHPGVSPISETEKETQLERLREFYKDYVLYTEQNLFYGGNYLVWRENGEILAGCQANPEVWQLVHYPGGMNKFMMKYASRLPFVRKMFVPGYQKFVAVEGIWYREGCEKHLFHLFESACAMHGLHTAVIWLDESSPLHTTIRTGGKLGIIDRLLQQAVVDIRVKFNHFRKEEKKAYFNRPAYVSCFDLT